MAVKVFPAGWKLRFAAEKEVYELPLIGHSGIVHFLGTARKPHGDCWFIVLQFAENVSDNHSLRYKLAVYLCFLRYKDGRK